MFFYRREWELRDVLLCSTRCTGDKAAAVAAFNAGRIERFGANKSRFPQGCTDYERWKAATQQYSVVYCNRCGRMGRMGS